MLAREGACLPEAAEASLTAFEEEDHSHIPMQSHRWQRGKGLVWIRFCLVNDAFQRDADVNHGPMVGSSGKKILTNCL